VGQDKLSREFYFPTMMFIRDLDDAVSVNSELTKLIRSERARDEAGIERSNFKSLGGWHSQNNLHQREEFSVIRDRILEQGAQISRDLQYDPGCHLGIDSMWSIINGAGSHNKAHIHPGSIWSGVYYVQAPEGGGDIEFTDPRTEHLMKQAKFKPGQTRPMEAWTKVRFTPKPGKMIIFPSWLYHSVDPNLSTAEGLDAERIIISFNLSQVSGAG
jgi:uncharacterized protein (TIGR02466 family)